jgi:amino acid transporter
MDLANFLFGRPLKSTEDEQQKIGWLSGIPTFGLDALSSAAYGPEAALTILLPVGAAGLAYIQPLSLAIVILLVIVYFSYRQTIAAYPSGGGSYTVAKENLGPRAGLLAAAALMIDYILNVAVGISAGVGALVSALPGLQPHTLVMCLAILVLLTVVNLRGTREAGVVFMAPTYVYIACLLGVIAWGVVQTLASGGHPHARISPPPLAKPEEAVALWLLLKAFSSGCTALTGVEAVSNGVQAFHEPVVGNARRTLTVIIANLALLVAGVAYLTRAYGIGATPPGEAGYQSVLSQLTAAVAGKGVFYSVTMASILVVLCLSANTSFADFPRLCRAIAADGYLPRAFTTRGRRLVYTEGIVVLAVLSAMLLTIFGGVTDRLIPLFAVGAFLAFTFSQAGMVAHWRKTGGSGARSSMFVNGLGALATGITTLVVLAAKFAEGAWVVVLLAPSMLLLMVSVRRHYGRVAREIAPKPDYLSHKLEPPVVVLPIQGLNSITQKALRIALSMSPDVEVVHVESEQSKWSDEEWDRDVRRPAEAAGLPVPHVTVLNSPYRFVIHPIMNYILQVERQHKDRTVVVLIPELVERRWYQYFLHNQRARLLSALLLLQGDRRIVIVSVPWYLEK